MNASPAPMTAALPHPVRLIGALLLAVLLAVGWARWQGVGLRFADAPTTWSRDLQFVDTTDGDVLAVDAASHQSVARFSGEQGFLRGTLRALARERQRRGVDRSAPLQLLGRQDGRLTLLDPATGQRIELEAFGPTNAAVFASLQPQAPDAHPEVLTERKSL